MTSPAASLDSLSPLAFGATSAAGPMVTRSLARTISASGALSVPATTASGVARLIEFGVVAFEQTHSGIQFLDTTDSGCRAASSSGPALLELRRLSGLTWENLAELFGVSRRTLHFWASGKPQNSSNERRLRRMLAALHEIDRGTARENRAALFEAQPDGVIPFNLLRDERYVEAIARLGRQAPSPRPARPPLSPEAQVARRPPKPEELIGALHEPVHRDIGKAQAVRARRVKSPK